MKVIQHVLTDVHIMLKLAFTFPKASYRVNDADTTTKLIIKGYN